MLSTVKKKKLPFDPILVFLRYHLKEVIIKRHENLCTKIYIVVLFKIRTDLNVPH